jgi:hypothetical protein
MKDGRKVEMPFFSSIRMPNGTLSEYPIFQRNIEDEIKKN